jgi:hypothetical protein
LKTDVDSIDKEVENEVLNNWAKDLKLKKKQQYMLEILIRK